MSEGTPRQRLYSLDVFRGMTLALMVLVNNPGDSRYVYSPFEHMRWHGWSPTDLVFPFFVFIVGVAIPFAFASRVARGESRGKLYAQIVRRSVLLFALGLALNGFPKYDFSTLRIMGILQRIALCYLACSFIYLHSKPRTRAWIAGSLLVLYFVALKFIPVPGVGVATLERDGNWVQFFDVRIMGGHLQSRTWEGKGLLSTLPAIANCLFGLFAGEYLRTAREPLEKAAGMYTAGTAAMLAGAWSSSLVVFMSGMALTLLAACYYVIDIRKWDWWTKPFLIFGLNSIAIWAGSWLLSRTLELTSAKAAIFGWLAWWAGNYNGSLLYAIGSVFIWLGVMAVLYRRGIFLKI
ncbi:MAG: DUF5009 domain-containing protein [Acidobacteria bacterium]|nr:DUF5009 domain-containing protein [Acidobacteriota bacterium]